MSFTNTNDYITGRKPVPTPAELDVVAVRFTLDLALADLALNTIGQVGILPAGYVPVDVFVDGTDMDTGAGAGVYQVGIWDGAGASLSTATADGTGAWGDTGTASATAFSKAIVRTLNNINLVTPTNVDRKIGVKVTTAPSTAAAGTLGVTVLYRAAA
jgi:hypothetical protein